MFGNHHFDQVRVLFSDQFEAEGDSFIYRKSMKEAPVRVSRSERDEFIARFNRNLRQLSWGILVGTLTLLVAAALVISDPQGEFLEYTIYVGVGGIVSISMLFYWWAWTRPARDVERRPVLGERRSRAEMRQLILERTSYRQLALAGVGGLALLFEVSQEHDILSGWGRCGPWDAGSFSSGLPSRHSENGGTAPLETRPD